MLQTISNNIAKVVYKTFKAAGPVPFKPYTSQHTMNLIRLRKCIHSFMRQAKQGHLWYMPWGTIRTGIETSLLQSDQDGKLRFLLAITRGCICSSDSVDMCLEGIGERYAMSSYQLSCSSNADKTVFVGRNCFYVRPIYVKRGIESSMEGC